MGAINRQAVDSTGIVRLPSDEADAVIEPVWHQLHLPQLFFLCEAPIRVVAEQGKSAAAEWNLAQRRARDLVRTALVDDPDYTFEKAQQFAFYAIEAGLIVGLGARDELVLEAISGLRPEDVGCRPMSLERVGVRKT